MNTYKLSIVQKICFAGIFIVLAAIFQKAFAITIPVMPFARISFGGAAVIIISSILLGPWFGLLIGASSDLLGFFIFDPKTLAPYPMFQITLIYALLGFISYFAYKLIFKIKNDRQILLIEGIVMAIILLAISLFIGLNNSLTIYGKTYDLTATIKICVPIIIFILLLVLLLFTYFVGKRFEKKEFGISVYKVSFLSFLLEAFVMVIFGSAMKVWAFSVYNVTPFIAIVIVQMVIGFFNVPFNTILISYIMLLLDKILIRGKR